MGFNNRIFNVNGKGEEQLQKALELAFLQSEHTCRCWRETKENGLILCWPLRDKNKDNLNYFPADMNAGDCIPFVSKWLGSDFAETVHRDEGCAPYKDGDVWNEDGWQVYCDFWGHVGDEHYSIVAVRPCSLWLGK